MLEGPLKNVFFLKKVNLTSEAYMSFLLLKKGLQSSTLSDLLFVVFCLFSIWGGIYRRMSLIQRGKLGVNAYFGYLIGKNLGQQLQ